MSTAARRSVYAGTHALLLSAFLSLFVIKFHSRFLSFFLRVRCACVFMREILKRSFYCPKLVQFSADSDPFHSMRCCKYAVVNEAKLNRVVGTVVGASKFLLCKLTGLILMFLLFKVIQVTLKTSNLAGHINYAVISLNTFKLEKRLKVAAI